MKRNKSPETEPVTKKGSASGTDRAPEKGSASEADSVLEKGSVSEAELASDNGFVSEAEPISPDRLPDSKIIQAELHRINYKSNFRSALGVTVSTLLVVAAAALLVASLWMPVFRVYGDSMTPSIGTKVIVAAIKTVEPDRGDVIAFYHNNNILIRRVIALSGDTVDVDESGAVKVNGTLLDEPYVTEAALGESNIIYPFTVPEERVFVMGDNRATAIDSRNDVIGCIAQEQIIGRLLLTVWPLEEFKIVE